jgi:hypothetical protein
MDDVAAFTIEQFCKRNQISRPQFYVMPIRPRVMHAGAKKRLITREAEKDWQRECEAAGVTAGTMAA